MSRMNSGDPSFPAGDADRPPSVDRRRGRQSGGLSIFYTVEEVAEALGVSPRTLRRWIKSGDLPFHRFGGAVRISAIDLRAFVATHREG